MDGFAMEALRNLAPAIVAVVGAIWAARGVIADQDRRISVLESQLKTQNDTTANALADIRSDLRELRTVLLGDRRK